MSNKTSVSFSLVGLPNVGKSTLFNILTNSTSAESANFPFCTIDPNIGVVNVVDSRVDVLSGISNSKKIVYSQIKIVDVAGLVSGASEGAGLGNQFLANVRQTSAVVHVVRFFKDDNTTHVMGRVDPLDDIDVIQTEFLLADLKMAQGICDRLVKKSKSDPDVKKKLSVLEKVVANLSDSIEVKAMIFDSVEQLIVDEYEFLTSKLSVYALNVSEQDMKNKQQIDIILSKIENKTGVRAIPFCAALEEMCISVDEAVKKEMFDSYGYGLDSGSECIVRQIFSNMGLISFFTSGEMESRSWPITKGTSASEAAGKIHQDLQKGFIRAEVISYTDYIDCGGRVNAKEKGLAKLAGKDYVVNDGDVILFLHKI